MQAVQGTGSFRDRAVLGGSWVVIRTVISPFIWVITISTVIVTPLITTHEPPSRDLALGFRASGPEVTAAFASEMGYCGFEDILGVLNTKP